MESSDGHMTKRLRNDSGTGVRAGGRESVDLEHKVPPSPVVHVRGLLEQVSENDLHEAVINFGTISYIIKIPNRNMALIEFENVESATALVNYAQSHTIMVFNRAAQFNYSTSSRIKRPDSNVVTEPNFVILISVSNARHPITIEVINAICAPYGSVLRIVIFRKNGVQAMVEFDNVESATQAKNSLHGQDIYSGCCTIKSEFAKPTTLNVKRNEGDTWDFTVSEDQSYSGSRQHHPLLAEPHYGGRPVPYANYGGDMSRRQTNYGPGPSQVPVQYPMQGPGYQTMQYGTGSYGTDMYDGSGSASYPTPVALLNAYESQSTASSSGSNPSCVLMIYGMDPVRFNCQRVFNLLCVYGNVIKVKFLKTMEGSAMVQMGDRESCDRVINNLNGASCFGSGLSISMSKQVFLQDAVNPHALHDGTSAYADFIGSRNQRFTTSDVAAKKRPVPPTSALYFYNAPPGISEAALHEIFENINGVCPPDKICMFPPRSEKSSRGLILWQSVENCIEALACANHAEIPNPAGGRNPFILKMMFSQSTA